MQAHRDERSADLPPQAGSPPVVDGHALALPGASLRPGAPPRATAPVEASPIWRPSSGEDEPGATVAALPEPTGLAAELPATAGAPALRPMERSDVPVRGAEPPPLAAQVLAHASLLATPVGRVVRFRLEPEHLGELEVQLVLRGASLSLRVRAASDEVGETIAATWPELRHALAAHGLQPERMVVSVAGADVSSSLGGGWQPSSHDSRQQPPAPWAAMPVSAATTEHARPSAPDALDAPAHTDARVDYRV
jgi:hypothetical protein